MTKKTTKKKPANSTPKKQQIQVYNDDGSDAFEKHQHNVMLQEFDRSGIANIETFTY